MEGKKAFSQRIISGEEHYKKVGELDLTYGPLFQGVKQVWQGGEEALGSLVFLKEKLVFFDHYAIHPTLLDACFQLVFAIQSEKLKSCYLPVSVQSFQMLKPLDTKTDEVWGYVENYSYREQQIQGDVFLLDKNGEKVCQVLGLVLQALNQEVGKEKQKDQETEFYRIRWNHFEPSQANKAEKISPKEKGSWLLFSDDKGIGDEFKTLLEKQGENVISAKKEEGKSSDDIKSLIEKYEAMPGEKRGILHFWSLNAPATEEMTPDSLQETLDMSCMSLIHTVQSISQSGWRSHPRLWLFTSGVQSPELEEKISVSQSPVWGLGKVLLYEHPELEGTLIDLDPVQTREDIQNIYPLLWSELKENFLVWRKKNQYAARLLKHSKKEILTDNLPVEKQKKVALEKQSYSLTIAELGRLDNLVLQRNPRKVPGPGEVEIQVTDVGINFKDVLTAMGVYPGLVPGEPVTWTGELSGKVVSLGPGTTGFSLGDEVFSVAPGDISLYKVLSSDILHKKPEHLSAAEMATIPITFMTAYYTLVYLGRMMAGERVLIHSAAGGVGFGCYTDCKTCRSGNLCHCRK